MLCTILKILTLLKDYSYTDGATRDFFKIFFLLGKRAHPVSDAWAWVIKREEDEVGSGEALGYLIFKLILCSQYEVECL